MSSKPVSTLFTSIPPGLKRPVDGCDFGASWHAACIESWKAEGFRVVSLNGADELSSLRLFEACVDFVELPVGRGRPLITDFLAAAAISDSKTAGIINADCLLIPQTGLAKHLAGELDGVVIAERLNLSQATLRPTGEPFFGFDAFFFATEALTAIDRDDHWRIGDTWWDYWLPLSFQLAGFGLKTLPAPILAHLDHEPGWGAQAWERNSQRLLDLLRVREASLGDPDLAAIVKATPAILQPSDSHALSHKLFYWLSSREPLWRPEENSVDDLLMRILKALATAPPQHVGRGRALLRRAIDILGLRPAMDLLRLH